MPDFPEPAEAEGIRETLHEHMELAHYIDVFKNSAERVRRVVFVIMVFSVVMLVAQWNTTCASWIPRRWSHLNDVYAKALKAPTPAEAENIVRKGTANRIQSLEELRNFLDEYRRLRVERVFLVEIPGVGVNFDINDLGNFCGVSYFLLLAMLLYSLMREHENLYLALFKVRRLHDRAAHKSDGESAANYLYHALAMSQVLNAPPTLAQWKQPWTKRALLDCIFYVPAFVQGYIIVINAISIVVAQAYGLSAVLAMAVQAALFVINLGMGWAAQKYSKSCDHRWRSAFLYINPALKFVDGQPVGLWLKLSPVGSRNHIQRRLWSQSVEHLTIAEEPPDRTEKASHTVTLTGSEIAYHDIFEMCRVLEAKAVEQARDGCTTHHVLSGDIIESTIDPPLWHATGAFGLRCHKQPDVSHFTHHEPDRDAAPHASGGASTTQ